MTAVTDLVEGFAGLGVPWWGWTALLAMIFWGLLVPDAQGSPEEPEIPSAALPRGR